MWLVMRIESVLNLYEGIYKKINGKNPKISKTQLKAVQNFYEFINLQFCAYEQWWFDYLCYQFEYFCEKDTQFGKGKILPNWVFGKRAYERWLGRDDEFWLHWVDKFIEKYNIERVRVEVGVDKDSIEIFRENERKRFFNSDNGLLHCKTLNLFNLKSKSCRICKFNNICNE